MKAKKWLLAVSVWNLVVGLPSSSASAHAAEVCETIETCQSLKAKVEVRLGKLRGLPNLTDIARDTNGSVSVMTHSEADQYCRDRKMRLPTARELALYAQTRGALGIFDAPKAEDSGYYTDVVLGQDPQGRVDSFFYSGLGYQSPEGDLGEVGLWTSSADPEERDKFYLWHSSSGWFWRLDESDSSANLIFYSKDRDREGFRYLDVGLSVRCVQSR